jgi:branched-chain amino acid aminotransferase
MTIPFDQRDGFIWLDGNMVPWRAAQAHVLTHGLHYGSCVFEGERVYEGRIFKLREHTLRLASSARQLGFALPFTDDELDQASAAVVAANRITEGYVRPFAWRGSEQLSIGAPLSRIHVAIAAWPLGGYFKVEAALQGLRLHPSAWRRPQPGTAPVHAKAAGLYMTSTIAKHAALEAGYDDALLCDWRGNVAEASGANVFFVIDQALHTPVPDCFLDGITRRTIIGLAKALEIPVIERPIAPLEIGAAQEAFLTGTAAEVMPIGAIGERVLPERRLTLRLAEAYRDLVRAKGHDAAAE